MDSHPLSGLEEWMGATRKLLLHQGSSLVDMFIEKSAFPGSYVPTNPGRQSIQKHFLTEPGNSRHWLLALRASPSESHIALTLTSMNAANNIPLLMQRPASKN